MTYKTLLTLKALVCLVLGSLIIVVPGPLFDVFGASLDDAGRIPAREYGAAMLGTLVLTWLARSLTDPTVRRIILLDLLVYDAVGVAVTLPPVWAGTLNALGWGIVAIYAFFTLGSAYLLLATQVGQASRAATT